MVKITCSSCQKQLSIDETKLPMKEVSFPCPLCKAKLNIDRRTLGGEAPVAADAAVITNAEDDDEYGEKGLMVGQDLPAARIAIRSIGLKPLHLPTAEAARDLFVQEYPKLALLIPAQLTAPPLAEFSALTSVSPADRRKGFFVLIADNLRTLDGNAAFLYGVNLVIATKDLGAFSKIHRDAEVFHTRLYQTMQSVIADVGRH